MMGTSLSSCHSFLFPSILPSFPTSLSDLISAILALRSSLPPCLLPCDPLFYFFPSSRILRAFSCKPSILRFLIRLFFCNSSPFPFMSSGLSRLISFVCAFLPTFGLLLLSVFPFVRLPVLLLQCIFTTSSLFGVIFSSFFCKGICVRLASFNKRATLRTNTVTL